MLPRAPQGPRPFFGLVQPLRKRVQLLVDAIEPGNGDAEVVSGQIQLRRGVCLFPSPCLPGRKNPQDTGKRVEFRLKRSFPSKGVYRVGIVIMLIRLSVTILVNRIEVIVITMVIELTRAQARILLVHI